MLYSCIVIISTNYFLELHILSITVLIARRFSLNGDPRKIHLMKLKVENGVGKHSHRIVVHFHAIFTSLIGGGTIDFYLNKHK